MGASISGRISPADMRACSSSAGRVQLGDVPVGFGPDRDRLLHEAHVAKAPEQHDHPVDVLGIVLAGDEPSARNFEIGIGLLELEPRHTVAHRDRDRGLVGREVRLGPGLRVPEEAVDGFLLRLRPQALAANVRAARGDDPDAFGREEDEDQDDHEERPRDPQEPQAQGRVRARFSQGRYGHFISQRTPYRREPLA
jgi:hypothetical protein